MPALPAIGNLTYNGITFDGASNVSVNVEPVMDDAKLTIIYQRHTIKAHAVVTNAGGTDATMQNIRNALLEPARQLVFVGKGFGNDMVVGPGQDVAGGPMPRILSWTVIAANKAVEFDWEITVCVARCMGVTQGKTAGIMALNYEISFAIDEHGMTTRTISGYLQIAQGRRPNRTLRDTADNYLNRFVVKLEKGFKRTQSRHLSKDKARLDFTIHDTQIPSNNPYPEYHTAVSGRHHVRWTRGRAGASLFNTLELKLSPKLGISGTQAWAYFIHVLSARLAIANKGTKRVFVDGLEVDEDLFGFPCGFSASYRILNKAGDDSMNELVRGMASIPGLWTPLDTDWTKWKASMSDVFSQVGMAGMRHQLGNADLILDLCDNGGTPLVAHPSKHIPRGPKNPREPNPYTPDRSSSYLRYTNVITPSAHNPIARQATMQPAENDSQNNGGGELQDGYPKFPTPGQGTPDVLQQGGKGRYTIGMRGMAVRAGYPIAKPVLEAQGGNAPAAFVQTRATFSQVVGDSSFGVPVYTAAWDIEYALDGSPGEVRTFKNIAEAYTAATATLGTK